MLSYNLVCSLTGEDRQAIRNGIRTLATIARRYEIPVTWAVDAQSARSFASLLTEGHEQGGDDVILLLDIGPLLMPTEEHQNMRERAQDQVRMREAFPPFIEAERDRLVRALPWVTPTVAGAMLKNEVLAPALEQVGFLGLWGYRWEQAEPEGAKDRGCPLGYFPIGKSRHNGSGTPLTHVIGVPYASVDLVGVLNGRVPYDASAELIYALQRNTARVPLEIYRQNVDWNSHLTCVQHVTVEHLAQMDEQETVALLEQHLEFVHELLGNCCQTVAQSIASYRQVTEEERRTLVLVDDEDTSKAFYYDDACQLVFDKGALSPHAVRNYLTPAFESRYCAEMALPEMTRCEPSRQREVLLFEFELDSPKEMPYGVAIWGDHFRLRLKQTNAEAVHRIGSHLLLVRMMLRMGGNQVQVALTI